ncbi:alpha/beta hydrolase [Actinomycetospora termitidis]|uniref:Alpha/beta hydrolase n=1 Tax=Actinomycetospora termitidis TaxID=3053470 RepID=A0ABT7MD10_9PSEU|nr:alpha/beta hydrolase [Actinomycetospora sp. Odt1-22]MDL5158545.1 alpha/beta hydrolase [Actinomycetospora sp. Odt1-22]
MAWDPELAAALPALPDLHIADLGAARERMRELAARAPEPPPGAVEEETVPGPDGGSVRVLVARPPGTGPAPGVLLLHGGGFVMGAADMSAAQAATLATELGAVVVVPDYRLAPEHPYPAALDDCAAALAWLAGRPDVDPARVALYGMSAGGGLAAALTLLGRDRGGPAVCFQVLDAPEVDDRLSTPSMRAFVDTPLWSRPDAELSWRHYLSGLDGDVPVYAAPARATDLAGLPPAHVAVYENDPLRDEGLAYATALLTAGVSVELHLFPGTFHRSAILAAEVSRRQAAETVAALRRAFS